MAIERLVETTELRTSKWRQIIADRSFEPQLRYNEKTDALTLLLVPRNTPTIVHYIDDHVALLYIPENREVVGLRVESFRRSFLPKYADLQEEWRLSSNCRLEDFGDLIIMVQKYAELEPIFAKKLSRITHRLAEERGLELPVPA